MKNVLVISILLLIATNVFADPYKYAHLGTAAPSFAHIPVGDIFHARISYDGTGGHTFEAALTAEKLNGTVRILDYTFTQSGSNPMELFPSRYSAHMKPGTTASQLSMGNTTLLVFFKYEGNDALRIPKPRFMAFNWKGGNAFLSRTLLNIPSGSYAMKLTRFSKGTQELIFSEIAETTADWSPNRPAEQRVLSTPATRMAISKLVTAAMNNKDGKSFYKVLCEISLNPQL